jgi:glycerol uptake facilitator-like aquaporin
MQKLLAEFLGTLFFMFVIITTGNAYLIGAALALVVVIGGGHYNPAVTLMMTFAGKHAMKDLAPFVLVQLAAGIAAFELSKLL